MKKQDIIDHLVKQTNLPKNQVASVFDAFVEMIPQVLKEKGELQIVGIGTLTVHTRKKLVNPQTRKVMKDKQVRYVSFSQGQRVKDAINE